MFNIEGSGYCIEGWGLGRAIEGSGIAIRKNNSNIQTRTGGFGVAVSPFVI